MHKIIVTSAENPDLDGLACSYAYTEYLKKKGIDADYAIFGRPFEEAKFILRKAKVRLKKTAVTGEEKFILVDTSIVSRIPKIIRLENVIEVIDHRKFNDSSAFTRAKLQIELVGAAATLITEKFMQEKIPISYETRFLLFYAILSNTLNFKNNVTTGRDRKAAAWLKHGLKLEKSYLKEFLLAKSRITNLPNAIKDYMGVFDFSGTKICISQLEILDTKNFIAKNESKISKILRSLENSNAVNDSLLTAIDIEKAENVFYSESPKVQRGLAELFRIKFKNSVAYRKGIIMRKELGPLLDEYFKKHLK